MKVAIPLFGSRISPRFDFSPEIWIVTVESGRVVSQEKFPMTHLDLPQRLDQLTLRGVNKVICGGIDGFCLNQLGTRGIEVLENVVGDAGIAFNLFLNGKLKPGHMCDRRRRGRFCGWRKGPPWN